MQLTSIFSAWRLAREQAQYIWQYNQMAITKFKKFHRRLKKFKLRILLNLFYQM